MLEARFPLDDSTCLLVFSTPYFFVATFSRIPFPYPIFRSHFALLFLTFPCPYDLRVGECSLGSGMQLVRVRARPGRQRAFCP